MRLEFNFAAQVGEHFFESSHEIVAHAGAGTVTRFDSDARLICARSF
jgi:hypothetical protein